MNISVLRRYALSNCVAAAMLSGCGGSQSPIGAQGSMPQNRAAMPQATHLPAPVGTARLGSLLAPQVSKRPVVYVAAGEVYVYPESPANSAPYGEIGSSQGVDGPWGLQVGGGSKGLTLYVANWGTNSVTAYYNRVYKKPDATYSYGVNRPMYVVVDSHSNLYISNANTGAVVEFPIGNTTHSQTLQIGTSSAPGVEADGMDFDGSGNLYVAYRTQPSAPGGSIEEFAPGSTTGTILGMSLNQPQGLIVDQNGNISVVETGGTNRIDYFPAGTTTPSLTIPIPETPGEMALTEYYSRVYLSAEGGDVYVLPYPFTPSTQPEVLDTVTGEPQGVAISPNQQFER